MSFIKKVITKILIIIKTIFIKINFFALKHRLKKTNQKKIWFIATPIYRNLGDYAIVFAQYKLLDDIGLKDNIIELTRFEYEVLRNKLKKIVKKGDLIIIDGGGNIGTLWIEEEMKMRDIVQRFKDNPIFIFPQTAFFDDTKYGKNELNQSINIYNNHENLTVFCRDIDTYNLFKSKFNRVQSIYVPDIVMYIDNLPKENKEKIVLLNIRDDKESIINTGIVDSTKQLFKDKGFDVKESSTISKCSVNRRNRKKLLMNKLNEYSKAKLVITDRLHGMIFSAITGTPCISLDNKSHKVKNCYIWIEHLKFIKYCNSMNQFKNSIMNIEKLMDTDYIYNFKPNEDYFNTIKEKVLYEYNK